MLKFLKAFIVVGIVFYFTIGTFLFALPTVRSLISSGWQLVVVGLALSLWKAWQEKKIRRVWALLGVCLCLPVITLLTLGFVSYGVAAMLALCAFVAAFYRPRARLVMAGILIGYLGLSFYVGYMKERANIREAVWGGQDYSIRAERTITIFTSFEFFDPFNPEHLQRVDDRLNQNLLVGAAIDQLSTGVRPYANGDTFVEAIEALVPRAIWPDKPITAGSNDLVSKYTGITFAEGTSVGIGQVIEFYINFGTIGVIIGFLIFGIVVTVIDQVAIFHLVKGDWRGFTIWYLPGLAFLQAGGQFVEITATAAASLAVALLVTWAMVMYYRTPANKGVGSFIEPGQAAANLAITQPKHNALESGGD